MTEQVWAISMFKDEADIAAHVVHHLIDEGVDGIIIADNMSTDETRELILSCTSYAEKNNVILMVETDNEVGHYQSKKMTRLAAKAASFGASWIVPFDADEIWYSKTGRLADTLRALDANVSIAHCHMLNHFATALDANVEACPFVNLQWCEPKLSEYPKVAFRWVPEAVIHEGNHGVDLPSGERANCLELRHFPFRSFEHLKNKTIKGKKAFEAAPELGTNLGVHWRLLWKILDDEGEEGLLKFYTEKLWYADPVGSGLVHSPAPFRRYQAK